MNLTYKDGPPWGNERPIVEKPDSLSVCTLYIVVCRTVVVFLEKRGGTSSHQVCCKVSDFPVLGCVEIVYFISRTWTPRSIGGPQ